jgi:hypothetical protein
MKSGRIEIAAIERMLRGLDFVVADNEGRAGETWRSSTDPELPTVLVPRERDRELAGFDALVASAVERLGWITGLAPQDVLRRLLSVRDRFELRIQHSLTDAHSIQLTSAPAVISGFVELLKAGARASAEGTRADFRSSPSAESKSTWRALELLAPEPGSFRLVAISRDHPQLMIDSDVMSSSAREGLASTMSALQTLEERAPQGRSRPDANELEPLIDAGVSVQMLGAIEQIASFTTSAGMALEFETNWDPMLGPAPVPDRPAVLTDGHLSAIRTVRPLLKRKYEPRRDFPLHGWVAETRAPERNLEGSPRGTVVVRADLDGREVAVRVQLDDSVFPDARAGVTEVRATGTLERVRGRWQLTDVRHVRLRNHD